jgi:GNAT superfamily N-acetyltransferase
VRSDADCDISGPTKNVIADHDVEIRAACPADAEAVAGLLGELGYPAPVAKALAYLERLPLEDAALLVATSASGAVIGWIEVIETSHLESGDVAEITGLVVTASERGRAVGSTLLTAAEAWARRRGLGRIRVRSNVIRERTHGFYADRGYVERKRQVVFQKGL